MESINVLYLALKPEADDAVSSIRNAVGRNIHVTCDPAQARNLLSSGDFHVGLIQFEPFDENFFQRVIGDIFYYPEGSSMQWVALVSSSSMENEAVCRLIADLRLSHVAFRYRPTQDYTRSCIRHGGS